MNQPVRVSLVFPRSGQQVFVHLPSQMAHSVADSPNAHTPNRLEYSSPAAAPHTEYARDRDTSAS